MTPKLSPFVLMNTVFIGLTVSFVYGLASILLIYYLEGHPNYELFAEAYTTSFKTLISLGLILGSAIIVYRTQSIIPEAIEAAFTETQLSKTKYFFYKRRFDSRRRSMTFVAQFLAVGFVVFSWCQFPLPGLGKDLMLIAACAEYGLGVYIGRKLCYAGLMLHSLLAVSVTKNLFKKQELDAVNSYVNIISTLAIIFVYVHVTSYFGGPFLCRGLPGESIRIFLLFPAIVATPVLLIFNFYPRIVLRDLYSRSIDVEVKRLHKKLQSEDLSPFEKKAYLSEFDRMSRDELRYSLRLSLSDLPIGITILIMVLGPLLGK